LSGLGLSLANVVGGAESRRAASPSSRDVNCILIWSQGGVSHHDTLDPKPNAAVSVRGEFQAIDTAVPGVKFTDICPTLAKELGRYSVLRGWNPKNGSHGTADQYVMSGRKFNPAVPYPCYGSVVSYHKGFKSAMPPFVQLGSSVDRRFGGGTSGVLGLEYNPFEIVADPSTLKSSRSGTSRRRRESRTIAWIGAAGCSAQVDALQRQADLQPEAFDGRSMNTQDGLPDDHRFGDEAGVRDRRRGRELRDAYGRTSSVRAACSRRLVEAGVRFVTITDGGWDTHANNFNRFAIHEFHRWTKPCRSCSRTSNNAACWATRWSAGCVATWPHPEGELGERPRSLGDGPVSR
jgi:hypothetical protein